MKGALHSGRSDMFIAKEPNNNLAEGAGGVFVEGLKTCHPSGVKNDLA